MADNSACGECGPFNPRDMLNARVQKPPGLPRCTRTGSPKYKDWTPDVWRPDPRCTRPQDPASPKRGPRTSRNRGLRGIRDFVGFRTSQDLGLCGIRDFAGPRTSWDSRLHGTLDFVGSRTPQKTGPLHTADQNLVLWCSLREHKLTG